MVSNPKYYIHKNSNGTYAIWTIDDMYKITIDLKSYEQAVRILKIMPHSIIKEINENERT